MNKKMSVREFEQEKQASKVDDCRSTTVIQNDLVLSYNEVTYCETQEEKGHIQSNSTFLQAEIPKKQLQTEQTASEGS